MEVALPRPQAELLGVQIGDTFRLSDAYDECDREPPGPGGGPPADFQPCLPHTLVVVALPLTLTALLDQDDPAAPFWDAAVLPFDLPRDDPDGRFGRVYALFVSDAAMFGPLQSLVPGYRTLTRLLEPVPADAFDSAGLNTDLARFDALRNDLRSATGSLRASPEPALLRFQQERDFSVVPILLVLIQVIGIVFFFLAVMARLLVAREREEIALLRGRGASLLQVLGLYAIQLAPIALLAAALAPLIAAGAIGLLGYTKTFTGVTDGAWITTSLTPAAWALALAGAALAVGAVGAVLIPVAVVAHVRPGVARYVAARPHGAGVVQRYYLDVAFLAIAGFLIWAATQRDAIFTRDTVGGLSAEPLVLLTPALIGLAAVVLLLRLLPPLLRLLAWALRDHIALPLAAALHQTVRRPGPMTQLASLLMLAAALGAFAASYGGTVDRSFQERARYDAGVDLRLSLDAPADPTPLMTRLDTHPAVAEAVPADRRLTTTARTGGIGLAPVQLLALDSRRAVPMLWFRDDFAPDPLPALLARLRPSLDLGGLPLPDHPAQFHLWVRPSVPREDLSVWLQIRDADGRFLRVPLGRAARGATWQRLSGDPAGTIARSRARPPFTLHTISFTEPALRRIADPGALQLDDLTVRDQRGNETLLDDFEAARLPWTLLPASAADAGEGAHSGQGLLEYAWAAGVSPGRRGLFLPGPNLCRNGDCALNVLASRTLLRDQGLSVGDHTALRLGDFAVPARIVGAPDYFPTLDPNAAGGFLLADLNDLALLRGSIDLRPTSGSNELWISAVPDPARRAGLISTLTAAPYFATDVVDGRALLAGAVRVDGRDLLALDEPQLVDYRRAAVGFVWQQTGRNLIPYLDAAQNIELPMILAGLPRRTVQDRTRELLHAVNLEQRAGARPEQLSGGEQQRVSIAVALANQPPLLLADEPTGELDTRTGDQICDLFSSLNERFNVTTIVVTHDPRIAARLPRVVTIRDGRIATEAYDLVPPGGRNGPVAIRHEFAVLDATGRLQIPPHLRRAAGLGDHVHLELEDGRVTISRDPPHPGASSADLLAPQDPIGPDPSDTRS